MPIDLYSPNVLPPDHTRDDFDFDYREDLRVPIRMASRDHLLPMVWCKRHGWEEEVLDVAE